MTDSKRTRGLILNGASGVGKSRTLQELGALLGEKAVAHALVDLDFLTLSWPRPQDDPWGGQVARENLAAVTSNYRRNGIERVVVAHVYTDRTHLDGCRAALGAASADEAPLIRLRASRAVVEQRLRARHAADAPWELDGFLAGHDALTHALDAADLDDHIIDVDGLDPRAVAERVIEAAGW
ncbi:hypothetical protein [Microbacterium arabinogalactanolyticum]|uniref:hypothetical protein n=1 Tax=Microbacterium arabinogalactanolyticum TaxID=69365 RepID=UPI0025522D28|nr:hypothetical protein [Microbacterium arabinogalactanolyticum]GLC86740.1 hypothetical protein MIAR_33250 [Microbacterium arabinogalactanolyticum]